MSARGMPDNGRAQENKQMQDRHLMVLKDGSVVELSQYFDGIERQVKAYEEIRRILARRW